MSRSRSRVTTRSGPARAPAGAAVHLRAAARRHAAAPTRATGSRRSGARRRPQADQPRAASTHTLRQSASSTTDRPHAERPPASDQRDGQPQPATADEPRAEPARSAGTRPGPRADTPDRSSRSRSPTRPAAASSSHRRNAQHGQRRRHQRALIDRHPPLPRLRTRQGPLLRRPHRGRQRRLVQVRQAAVVHQVEELAVGGDDLRRRRLPSPAPRPRPAAAAASPPATAGPPPPPPGHASTNSAAIRGHRVARVVVERGQVHQDPAVLSPPGRHDRAMLPVLR